MPPDINRSKLLISIKKTKFIYYFYIIIKLDYPSKLINIKQVTSD